MVASDVSERILISPSGFAFSSMDQVTYRVKESTIEKAEQLADDPDEDLSNFSEAMRMMFERAEQYEKVQSQNDQLQATIDELHKKIDGLEQQAAKADRLQSEVNELRRDLDRKENQYQTLIDGLVKYDP